MVWRVREVMVNELTHLHDQDRVGGVERLRGRFGGEHVAHLARGRQLKVVGGAATREVDGAAGVFGQQDPLVGRTGPPKVGVGQVVAGAVSAPVHLKKSFLKKKNFRKSSFLEKKTCTFSYLVH